MNELLLIGIFFSSLIMTLIVFRMGLNYLFALLGVLGTLMFFIGPYIISIFGLAFPMAELFYAVFFFSTDLVSEYYGRKKAQQVAWAIIIISAAILPLVFIAIQIDPHQVDYLHPHLLVLVEVGPRILIVGTLFVIIEQHLDVILFHKIKKLTKGKKLWVRNMLSTSTVQTIDVLFFYPLAYWGVFPNLSELMLTALIFKLSLMFLDTPFIYLSRKFIPNSLKENWRKEIAPVALRNEK